MTRLTVNQFSSRRGLLEAVFDEIRAAGSHPARRRHDDGRSARRPRPHGRDLLQLLEPRFRVGRLHDAMATDPDSPKPCASAAGAVAGVTQLVDRIAGKQASPQAARMPST